MLFVLSPAKALDYTTPPTVAEHSQPAFLDEAAELIDILRAFTPAQVADLMKLSDKLAALNVARYAEWQRPFTPQNAKQAVLAFNGDVYEGLDAPTLPAAALAWAQARVRILSGLYGVLRPLDLMQAYRLEMGTALANPRGKTLYAYWGERIARTLDETLQAQDGEGERVLVNLASNEYFKAVDRKVLQARVVTPVFQDRKNGEYKIISFYAKRARGLMVRFAIDNRLGCVADLRAFDRDGYVGCEREANATTLVFRRDEP